MRINFGMSGRIVLGKCKDKHLKWKIRTSEATINYVDPRGFGHLQIIKGKLAKSINPNNLFTGNEYIDLGPDALIINNKPSSVFNIWKNILNTKQALKSVLMDQKYIAGLGNIYANEICHLIHVHPETPANLLNRIHIKRLIVVCERLLKAAITAGGTSFGDANTYRSSDGREGEYFKYLKVYGREKKRCLCLGKIKKYSFKNRATFFCDTCQPLLRRK